MKKIKFKQLSKNEYLTEASLGNFLSQLFKGEEIIHNKKIKELNFRPDYYLPCRKLIVEFDGFRHFTDNVIATQDVYKDFITLDNKFNLIRIPYFVQLSKRNIEFLFEDVIKNEFEIMNDFNKYPDGFIDFKAALPGQFTSIGFLRYCEFKVWTINKNKKGDDLVVEIELSLIDRYVTEGGSYFEYFPSTDVDEIKWNLDLLRSLEEDYIKDDLRLLNTDEIKNEIEFILCCSLEEEICDDCKKELEKKELVN